MPRRTRISPIGTPLHLIQRGNNRQQCFVNRTDFATYASFLKEASRTDEVQIHAWVFMTNHVHLLATPLHDGAVSRMMQKVGSAYTRHFNRSHGRTGTLWEGRFRSSLVLSESYYMACQRYIELNPVRANMVREPGDYHWSSYHTHASGRRASMWTPHTLYLGLGVTDDARRQNYRELVQQPLEDEKLDAIRIGLQRGHPLNDD